MTACENNGYNILDRFPKVGEMVGLAKGAQRKITDYKLSCYACNLIVQNGDPRKEVIALGKPIFTLLVQDKE